MPDQTKKQRDDLLATLVALVAFYGHEDNVDEHCHPRRAE
jgi:hypothetical protein